MSDRNAFESLREQLAALPRSEIRLPDMPVEQAIREAEIMHSAAVEDAEALAKVGVQAVSLENLNSAIGALRFTQAQYIAALGELKESAREWVRLLDPAARIAGHSLLCHAAHPRCDTGHQAHTRGRECRAYRARLAHPFGIG